jgi:hypothetical protein
MNGAFPFLLWVFGVDLPKQNRSAGRLPGLLFSDAMMIVGVGVLLLAVLALGIYLWMKPGRKKHRRHIRDGERVYRGSGHSSDVVESSAEAAEVERPVVPEVEEEEDEESEAEGEHHHQHEHGKRRYKYRVRRRGHRTRNPTLAETGGLPPVKTPESGKPC